MDEIHRMLLEQADRAIWQLETPEVDVDVAVHEARKCFKRIRGLLRLVRDEIPQESYVELNALFRDAGRDLSGMRTSAVLSETLEKVHERFPNQISEDEVARLVRKLRAYHEALREDVIPQETLFKQVVVRLKQGRAQMKALHLRGNHFPASGMKRVYARGHRGLALCQRNDAVANFHEWRKRVKYLRYHVRIFSPAWPPVLDGVTSELVTLSELLGLDHDLAELHHTLSEHPELRLKEPESGKSVALIEAYRDELEAQAFGVGMRLYAEKPKAFVHRMRVYWNAWQKEW